MVIILRIYQHIIVNMIEGVWNIKWWGAAGSLAGIVIITAFCMGVWWKNQNLKKEYQILEIKRTSEEEKYREMAQVLEKNRIQIHDIKNHLLLLREFAVKENYDELKQYLNEVWGEYTATKGKMWTQNEVLDTFLDKKMQEAEMEGMEFQIEADVLRRVPLTKTELCVLFGNLLDNAIEACRKIQVGKKKISVKISQKKNFLFIFIANTIQERPREKKGELISDKKNAELHGYGLKSVKQIVEKYGGTFQYEIKDDQFEVHIAFLGDER
ncbi:sensor histidine kinase [Sellimonas sp.]|uniref:sensor histidine kinase n=1 Tax=Sellimonas sp. TaxID=2021466 RepID=UPI00257D0458|nr:ATP-binding protein [Sellimonas sp.]